MTLPSHFTALSAALTACMDANKLGKAQGSREQYPSMTYTGLGRPASVPLLFITQARSTSDSYLRFQDMHLSASTQALLPLMRNTDWKRKQTTPTMCLTTDCWDPSSCQDLSTISCSKDPSRTVVGRILHFLEIKACWGFFGFFFSSYFYSPPTYTWGVTTLLIPHLHLRHYRTADSPLPLNTWDNPPHLCLRHYRTADDSWGLERNRPSI